MRSISPLDLPRQKLPPPTTTAPTTPPTVSDLEAAVSEAKDALNKHNAGVPYLTITNHEANIVKIQGLLDSLAEFGIKSNELNLAKNNEQVASNALNGAGSDKSTEISDYKNSLAVYEINKTDATNKLTIENNKLQDLLSQMSQESGLTAQLVAIETKKIEVNKLREKASGSQIKAPIAGTIQNLNISAGEDTIPESEIAIIQPNDSKFKLNVVVSREQAMQLKKGDIAEVQNGWYYSEILIVLNAIKNDPDSRGKNKILEFDVTGDVQNGQSLNISIGQRTKDYDAVVPNSAIREDNDGKFVLSVVQKSSPLGNRYYAERVDVEVLGSDDLQSAIAGQVFGGEFILTTANKPVEAGQLVRLAE